MQVFLLILIALFFGCLFKSPYNLIALVAGCFVFFCAGWAYGEGAANHRHERKAKELERKMQSLVVQVLVTEEGTNHQWGAFLQSVQGNKIIAALRRAASPGRSFTVRDMAGILTRLQFETLRDEMLDRGFLCWVDQDNHNRGVEWTRAGDALLRSVAHSPTRPVCVSSCDDTRNTHTHTQHTPAHQAALVFASGGQDVALQSD